MIFNILQERVFVWMSICIRLFSFAVNCMRNKNKYVQNLIYSIEGDQLFVKDPNDPSGQETMIIKGLTAKELVLGFNSEDSAVISQSLVAIGYSVYHEITFRKIFLN